MYFRESYKPNPIFIPHRVRSTNTRSGTTTSTETITLAPSNSSYVTQPELYTTTTDLFTKFCILVCDDCSEVLYRFHELVIQFANLVNIIWKIGLYL